MELGEVRLRLKNAGKRKPAAALIVAFFAIAAFYGLQGDYTIDVSDFTTTNDTGEAENNEGPAENTTGNLSSGNDSIVYRDRACWSNLTQSQNTSNESCPA